MPLNDALQYHTEYHVIGRGKAYFAPTVSGAATNDFRYLGNNTAFNVTMANTAADHFNTDSALGYLSDRTILSVTRSGTFELSQVDDNNLAMFIVADITAKTGTGGALPMIVVPTVKQGRYYMIGVDAANPSGIRDIASATVTGPSGTPSFSETTDYILDGPTGTIYIVPGGSIPDDSNIEITPTQGSGTYNHIAATATRTIEGALRFIADNPTAAKKGPNRECFIPSAILSPTGDFALKGDEYQVLPFEFTALGNMYFDGRAV